MTLSDYHPSVHGFTERESVSQRVAKTMAVHESKQGICGILQELIEQFFHGFQGSFLPSFAPASPALLSGNVSLSPDVVSLPPHGPSLQPPLSTDT